MKTLKALRKPFETPQRSVKIKILDNFSPRPESGQEGLIMIKKWFLRVHWFLIGSTHRKQIPRYFKVSNVYWRFDTYTAWKVSKCRDFSGPYFPVFGLNTEIYFVFTLIISRFASKHLTSYSVSPIRTKYGEMLRISPCSVRMREYTDQNNSEYGHYLRSNFCKFTLLPL